MKLRFVTAAVAPAALLTLTAFLMPAVHAQETPAAPPAAAPAATETKNLIDIASANPELSTFVSAVKTAGLTETLSGPGPFTVFAPTNAAFDKMPKAKRDALLADKTELARILKAHVLSTKLDSAAINRFSLPSKQTTLAGTKITLTPTTLMVNRAKITQPDIQASNGVIHLIGSVLSPNAKGGKNGKAGGKGAKAGKKGKKNLLNPPVTPPAAPTTPEAPPAAP